MTTREKVNGVASMQAGRIVVEDIPTFEEAKHIINDMVAEDEADFEITGVAGNYRIIQRDIELSSVEYEIKN